MPAPDALTIPGYTYGSADTARSPVTDEELTTLLTTLQWTDADARALRQAGEVLDDQVAAVVELWYGFIASHPHLVAYFARPDGTPDDGYLSRVRARFEQWIRDLCRRPWDRDWLDYQEEIALRHTAVKKNLTDGAAAPAEIPLRYLIAFVYPVTATIKDFLAAKGHPAEQVAAMSTAWFKAVVLTVTLWARPYGGDRW